MAGLTILGITIHMPSLAATATDRTLWYLTRTSADAAYVALTFSVMLDLLRTIA
jgi:fructoselysine-6-P-deglycase FrlB-like protein